MLAPVGSFHLPWGSVFQNLPSFPYDFGGLILVGLWEGGTVFSFTLIFSWRVAEPCSGLSQQDVVAFILSLLGSRMIQQQIQLLKSLLKEKSLGQLWGIFLCWCS